MHSAMPGGSSLRGLNSQNRSYQHDGQSHSTVGVAKTARMGIGTRNFGIFKKNLTSANKIFANEKLSHKVTIDFENLA